jgi:hypothetical protein
MHEPAVTLTDYGLAVECAIIAAWIGFTPTSRMGLRRAATCFFVFLGLSAALGGTVHGFFPDENSAVCQFLWQLTLQSIGLASVSTWIVGANLIATGRAARWLTFAALPQFVFYVPHALFFQQAFWIAFTIYLPAALLLFAGFCRGASRDGHRFLLVGAAGSVLSFGSSLIQFMRIGIDRDYFNHNALAHVVEGVAVVLFFMAIRYAIDPDIVNSGVMQIGRPDSNPLATNRAN